MTTNEPDDDIKDLLGNTAPEQPDLPAGARADAVRSRARAVRRRNGLALAAAAVVAVVGIGGGIAAITSGDDPSGTQVAADPTRSEAPAPEPPACPTEPIDVGGSTGVEALPDGAISVRACPATFSGGAGLPGGPDVTLPTEPLVQDADAFTSTVREMAPYEIDDECALIQIFPIPWAIVVSYPDGTSAILGTTSQLCDSVQVAGEGRGAEDVIAAFTDALASQEGTNGAPVLDPPLACPAVDELDAILTTPDTYTGPLADFEPVAGLVCYTADPQGAREYAEDEGQLTPQQLTVVRDDLAASSTDEPRLAGRCTDSGPTRVVVLAAQDGTRVVRVDRSCTTEFAGGGLYWRAGDEAEAILDRALGGRVD